MRTLSQGPFLFGICAVVVVLVGSVFMAFCEGF